MTWKTVFSKDVSDVIIDLSLLEVLECPDFVVVDDWILSWRILRSKFVNEHSNRLTYSMWFRFHVKLWVSWLPWPLKWLFLKISRKLTSHPHYSSFTHAIIHHRRGGSVAKVSDCGVQGWRFDSLLSQWPVKFPHRLVVELKKNFV